MLRVITADRVREIARLAATFYNTRDPSKLDDSYNSRRSHALLALRDAVAALPREARNELYALMYLGRGDFGGELSAALRQAERLDDEVVTSIIVGKALALPTYLPRGLSLVAARAA
jgi:hypothetical protein